jgi:hypothetical protein
MSFNELSLDKSAYEGQFRDELKEAQLRKMIGSSMSRMDESWSTLRRTTISVFCVVVAASHDRSLARELVIGMVDMMGKMCNLWASNAGGVTNEVPDHIDIRRASDSVDATGKKLGTSADDFLGSLMCRLLQELPKEMWANHFRLAVDSIRLLNSQLDASDASWASRQVGEEQIRLSSALITEVSQAVVEDSSSLAAAEQWVKAARGVFESMSNLGPSESLSNVIKTLGFPNAVED